MKIEKGLQWVLLLWIFGLSPLYADDYSDPILAKVYQSEDLTGWWVSEKLDGVRAIWNGKILLFRSGRPISAPNWFTESFPEYSMDGELWMGRGTFDRLSGTVRRDVPVDDEWRRIRYMLFELPDQPGTFTERVERMEQLVRSLKIPWLQVVSQERVGNDALLMQQLEQIVQQGGEGLMLHRADSHYHGGRSSDLLKLKSWQDAEAAVVEILPGKGKYDGMMGSLLVESENGRRFRIGSGFKLQERKNPPSVGTVITYKYTGLTPNGLPRFASFLRIHHTF